MANQIKLPASVIEGIRKALQKAEATLGRQEKLVAETRKEVEQLREAMAAVTAN